MSNATELIQKDLEVRQKIEKSVQTTAKDVLDEVTLLAVTTYMRKGGGLPHPSILSIRTGRLARAVQEYNADNYKFTQTDKQIIAEKIVQSDYAAVHEYGIPEGTVITPKQRAYFWFRYLESGKTDKMWMFLAKKVKVSRPKRSFIEPSLKNVDVARIFAENIQENTKDDPNIEVIIGT